MNFWDWSFQSVCSSASSTSTSEKRTYRTEDATVSVCPGAQGRKRHGTNPLQLPNSFLTSHAVLSKKKKKKKSRTWPIDTLPDITETARKGMIIIGNSKQYRFSLTTSLTDFTNAMFPLTLSDKLFCQVAKVPLQSLMCYNLCLMFCQCLLKWCLIAVQKQTNLYQNGIPFSETCLSSK